MIFKEIWDRNTNNYTTIIIYLWFIAFRTSLDKYLKKKSIKICINRGCKKRRRKSNEKIVEQARWSISRKSEEI